MRNYWKKRAISGLIAIGLVLISYLVQLISGINIFGTKVYIVIMGIGVVAVIIVHYYIDNYVPEDEDDDFR